MIAGERLFFEISTESELRQDATRLETFSIEADALDFSGTGLIRQVAAAAWARYELKKTLRRVREGVL